MRRKFSAFLPVVLLVIAIIVAPAMLTGCKKGNENAGIEEDGTGSDLKAAVQIEGGTKERAVGFDRPSETENVNNVIGDQNQGEPEGGEPEPQEPPAPPETPAPENPEPQEPEDLEPGNNDDGNTEETEEKIIGTGTFSWPLPAGEYNVFQNFGLTSDGRSYCFGIRMAAAMGTPIFAADSGQVTFSGLKDAYGNLIIINHNNGFETYYAHNSINLVNEGDGVIKGQKIAEVGTTGYATGPFLHFEIRENGTAVDPADYLP